MAACQAIFDERRHPSYNGSTMPELPEVETIAQDLNTALTGRTVTGIRVLWDRTIAAPHPAAFARRLRGQRILGVGRRGKWIVMQLSEGDRLLIHLRMTGRLVIELSQAQADRHARVLFYLDDGQRLRFSDVRKFGRMVLTSNMEEVLGDLGPEPLAPDFTPQQLGEMLAGRRARLKSLLLDQRFLAGLGNIYTDEALWRARLHPLCRCDQLAGTDVSRLHEAIREVLEAAVERRGTTLPDERYVTPDGESGAYAGRLAVYGREGERCPCCGTPIERIVVSGRGTHLCPLCQNRPSP